MLVCLKNVRNTVNSNITCYVFSEKKRDSTGGLAEIIMSSFNTHT